VRSDGTRKIIRHDLDWSTATTETAMARDAVADPPVEGSGLFKYVRHGVVVGWLRSSHFEERIEEFEEDGTEWGQENAEYIRDALKRRSLRRLRQIASDGCIGGEIDWTRLPDYDPGIEYVTIDEIRPARHRHPRGKGRNWAELARRPVVSVSKQCRPRSTISARTPGTRRLPRRARAPGRPAPDPPPIARHRGFVRVLGGRV